MQTRGKTSISLLVALCLSSGAQAQVEPEPDVIGLFMDQGATLSCTFTAAPFQTVTSFLCAMNISEPSGISYWECAVITEGSGFVAPTWTIGHYGANLLEPPLFAVTIGTAPPAPYSPVIVLATLLGFVMMPGMPVYFRLDGIPTPSLPDHPHNPAYAAGNDASALHPLWQYCGGTHETVVAAVNSWTRCCPDLPAERTTWGYIKSVF